MGVVVKRPVRVRVVVTDEFKIGRTAEIRAALARLDVIGKQLAMRIEASASEPESGLARKLRAEQARNEQARIALRRELDRLSEVAAGSEYDWGALEGNVEVEVGDDFSKLGTCEIVVKDGKIIEIRDGLCPELSETSS